MFDRRMVRLVAELSRLPTQDFLMIKKLILAVAVCLGSMTLLESQAEAGDCYSRGGYRAAYSYRPSVGVSPYAYRSSRVSYGVPVHRNVHPYGGYSRSISPYSSYRYGVGRSGFGYGPSFGPGFGPGFGYGGRGGISIGFGF